MNQIKRISLLVAILMILTARQAFAPTAVEKTKGEAAAPSSPSTAPGGTDKTFNEPKDQSILAALPPAPTSEGNNAPNNITTPDCVPPSCPTTPDCIPPSPNCPTPSSPAVYPVNNVCPSGYYCRASIIPVPGGRDATCTINESELEDSYRDCAKVIELCRNTKPSDIGALYQNLCSF